MSIPLRIEGPRHEISIEDERYPENLRHVPQPPKMLYLIGNPEVLVAGLAVIGARKATPYGLGCARRFAALAAAKGANIISGGARGCDSEAHIGALEGRGRTVAFLGGGCDEVYPPENLPLFQRIVEAGGAIVSENPWGMPPLPYMFRARNRLIAGLAEAVLIVEAGLPSGTFSTADAALDSGKGVLVVPGSITSPESRGSNRLLLQGAVPIVDDESFEDALFSALGFLKFTPGPSGEEEGEDAILAAVLAEPIRTDELLPLAVEVHGAERARALLMESLVQAEAAGIIARRPDGKWGPKVSSEP